MSIARIVLLIAAVLVLFGVGQRVLDRMRLTDRQALLFMGLIFVGGFIPSIRFSPSVAINIGGAIIPFGLCVYLFIKAGTAKEKWRSIIASVLTAGAVYALGVFVPSEPEAMPFDVNYLYGVCAALIAYLLGRSRICSFIAGVMGILLADIAVAVVNGITGTPVNLNLGGAGSMDLVVISGFLAVIVSEVAGKIIERFTGAHREVEIIDGQQVLVDKHKGGEK